MENVEHIFRGVDGAEDGHQPMSGTSEFGADLRITEDDTSLPGFDEEPGIEDDDGDVLPDTCHVVLFGGDETYDGPFLRYDGGGRPLLDVYDVVVRGKKGSRGAHVGRVPHDADESDVREQLGGGHYYVALRSARGSFISGRRVIVSGPPRVSASAVPVVAPAPAAKGEADAELVERLMARFESKLEVQSKSFEKQIERLRVEREQLRDELREADMRALEERAKRAEAAAVAVRDAVDEAPPAAPRSGRAAIADLLDELDEADSFRERLRERFGAATGGDDEGDGDLIDGIGEECERLADSFGKAKGLLDMMSSAD